MEMLVPRITRMLLAKVLYRSRILHIFPLECWGMPLFDKKIEKKKKKKMSILCKYVFPR